MRYTINIPGSTNIKLVERASAVGAPADKYIEQLVQDALAKPTLQEILKPVHEDFKASAMTEGELDNVLSEALERSRCERRAGRTTF